MIYSLKNVVNKLCDQDHRQEQYKRNQSHCIRNHRLSFCDKAVMAHVKCLVVLSVCLAMIVLEVEAAKTYVQ